MKRITSISRFDLWPRIWFALVFTWCFSSVALTASRADDVASITLTPATPDKPVTVRDRLIAGLQARLQSEVGFIDAVLAQVEAGHIPQQMVDETFFWARKKAGDTRFGRPRRPIIYFEPAMMARAKALNVTL
jgi:hypothetical protein